MVSALSKLANPWKCDANGCGQLRAKDTNHWLIVRPVTSCLRCDVHGTTAEHDLHLAQRMPGAPMTEVVISIWEDGLAELKESKHACGLPCGLKVASALIMETFFPAEISTAKGNDE